MSEMNARPRSQSQRHTAAELALANHILSDKKVLDAFGHVSIRSPDSPDTFLLARNMAPALVREEDIQLFDLAAETTDTRPSYLERYIHAEIYRVRSDVNAIVHSHSPAVIPFTIVETPLRPVMHMASFLPQKVPVFDIRNSLGDGTDLLIRNSVTGRALAASLSQDSAILMRGHGSVVVGSSLDEVTYRAVYMESNARAQAQAAELGSITGLSNQEAMAATLSISTQIQRAVGLWKKQASSELAHYNT